MRLIVLEYFLTQRAAVSPVDIETGIGNSDRVTIYRTLKTFEEKGMIHRIDDGSGISKYALCDDACSTDHHDLHIHFHCNSCKETTCHPGIFIPPLPLPNHFILEEVNLVAKGLCNRCAA